MSLVMLCRTAFHVWYIPECHVTWNLRRPLGSSTNNHAYTKSKLGLWQLMMTLHPESNTLRNTWTMSTNTGKISTASRKDARARWADRVCPVACSVPPRCTPNAVRMKCSYMPIHGIVPLMLAERTDRLREQLAVRTRPTFPSRTLNYWPYAGM